VEKGQQMSSTEHTVPDANRLYIGEGVTIKGEISVPDTLVVCGVVEGDVTVGNLIVGETGAIKGRISVAENAEISGKVFEKLDVKCLLILRATGHVDGKISYGLLQIEQGASIAGGLSSTDYRPEQRRPTVDVYPRDQTARKQDNSRGSKSAGLSLEPLPASPTPPAGQ
jgi:cytoskeletal protein CcmA (bactofilin family)